jgi:hypothetical protein
VSTKCGGHPSAPSYEYLRSRLGDVFAEQGHGVNAYEVVHAGELWFVRAGIVADPQVPWHEYTVLYRQTETRNGAWYESELQDTAGATVLGFAFAPEQGYQTAFYGEGSQHCFKEATPAHYAGTLALIDHTIFSERLSLAAAQAFTQ